MYIRSTILAVMILFHLDACCQDDYTIQIGDSSMSVALDKPYTISIGGKKVNMRLTQKDTLTHMDHLYTFKYPKGYKVTTTEVENGIQQLVLMSAEGTGVIIQRYDAYNPLPLTEFMLAELTKESIGYGYESKRTTFKKTLKNGVTVTVTKAELTYKDEVNIYEIASIGKKDAGIIIATIKMDDKMNSEGQKLIDLMWKSIELTL